MRIVCMLLTGTRFSWVFAKLTFSRGFSVFIKGAPLLTSNETVVSFVAALGEFRCSLGDWNSNFSADDGLEEVLTLLGDATSQWLVLPGADNDLEALLVGSFDSTGDFCALDVVEVSCFSGSSDAVFVSLRRLRLILKNNKCKNYGKHLVNLWRLNKSQLWCTSLFCAECHLRLHCPRG